MKETLCFANMPTNVFGSIEHVNSFEIHAGTLAKMALKME